MTKHMTKKKKVSKVVVKKGHRPSGVKDDLLIADEPYTKTPNPATKAEMEKRVNAVIEMILIGDSRRQMLLKIAKRWGYKIRMCDEMIQKANRAIHDEYEQQKKNSIAKHVARRERWIGKAEKQKKSGIWAALAVDDSLVRLKGLGSDGRGGGKSDLTPEENDALKKAAEELSKEMI